jgi:hypothetical protein
MFAAITAAAVSKSVGAEICGSTLTCGCCHRRESGANGSSSKTSRTACDRCPLSSASSRSSVTTTGPRAKLMKHAPGFIAASRPACNKPRVWTVSGTRQTTISLMRSRATSPSSFENVCTRGICFADRLHHVLLIKRSPFRPPSPPCPGSGRQCADERARRPPHRSRSGFRRGREHPPPGTSP